MPAKIHYEDNLFFLHSILRTVESGLRLDIDPGLFRDKILEDVLFVDVMILRLYASLRENDYLIRRTAYLRSLRRTTSSYLTFLDGLLGNPSLLESTLGRFQEKLESARQEHESVRREIDALLDRIEPDEETQSIVSSEEYGFLLARESQTEGEPEEDPEDEPEER
ncbi:MAG: hypothetical protein EA427_13180 [Spirochaetaceae bacterium]|nr:MAG: hypothetical protein EA427_13180 [Spirochaetaceae bacterium]